MLPIYDVIQIEDFIDEKSGRTKPWVVFANTPEGLKTYVVKLFTTAQINSFCLNNEVICNFLATEFELPVPKCVLLNIPEEITMNLEPEHQQQYYNADPRPKFATELISDVNSAILGLPKSIYKNRIEIDTTYGFDNLIRNYDRGQIKTNLLLSAESAYLIDHELAFNPKYIADINFNSFYIEDNFSKYHLFYSYLKQSTFKSKSSYFEEFEFFLNSLNVNKLNEYFHFLYNEGFPNNQSEIMAWLAQVKQNIRKFVELLRISIQ
ncbi:MAG: hypothetical protein PHP53_19120 [Prolixibacteraceae bacterium]|nr:hypothetical protein [Prolixibacteraceae bacterium]